MKKILFSAVAFFAIAVASAQSTRPTTAISAPLTGTENITGAATNNRITPQVATSTKTTTTASSATGTRNQEVETNYGVNNDGSSTGTTVTGNGGTNSATTVNAEPGKTIAIPRGR